MLTLPDCRSRGVLLALRNAAKFYQDGKVVDVAGPGKQLLSPGFDILRWSEISLKGYSNVSCQRLDGYLEAVPHLSG